MTDEPKPSDVVDSVPVVDDGIGADHADDGGGGDVTDTEVVDTPWYRKALRSTTPNPSIEEVDGASDLVDNWQSYLIRGLEKAAGVDDSEAWVDLSRGVAGGVFEAFGGDRDGDRDSTADTDTDTDSDSGAEGPIL